MPSLSDKLKSLGVKVGAAEIQPKADHFPIQRVVNGEMIRTDFGETFVSETRYPLDHRHGATPIGFDRLPEVLARWANDRSLSSLDPESFAFLDTETSGLSGGTGTYAFLIGVGRFEKGFFRLALFFMRDPSEEPALLSALTNFLAPAKALVTFNGKAFDVPLLKTRYTLHSLPIPFAQIPAHIDLLPLARRLWRDRLPSRALKYLEENILNAPRTSQEVPGYEIPYLYFDYLRTGDARPLSGVFYHNAMDVIAMSALLHHVADMLANPLAESIEHGLDVIALAKLYEEQGQWDLSARLYERGLEMNLAEADFWVTVKRLASLERKRGDIDSALRWWAQAAHQGHIYAHVELAKYYEHKRKDHKAALKWTRLAMNRVEQADIPLYERKHWLAELDHRRKRLEEKQSA
jgi:hypothetical protein